MTAIVHHIAAPTSPDAFLAAVHSPEGIAAWWSLDSDVDPRVGGTHVLRFTKGDRVVAMTFEVAEAGPDRVQWRCLDNANPVWPGTTLGFERTEEGVTLRHDGFAEDQSPPYQMTVEGWQHFAGSLGRHLRGEGGQPW